MKRIFLITFLIFISRLCAFSYSDGDSTNKCLKAWRENHHIDLSIGIGESVVLNALQWDKLFPIALKKRIKIGFGARLSVINYWNKDFFTGPPQQKPGTSFDTLRSQHQTTYFFNLQFLAEVALLKWWDVGMNIDLVGVSWGPVTPALYYSNSSGNDGSIQNTQPENLNLMLFGKNDFGNLNSQFYMRIWPSKDVSLKFGMSLATLTNLTEMPLSDGNSRFHGGSYMGFVSLGWTPGRNEWIKVGNKHKPNVYL